MVCVVATQGGVVHNQPYDESLEVSDGEEVPSANATPRGLDQPGTQANFFIRSLVYNMTLD